MFAKIKHYVRPNGKTIDTTIKLDDEYQEHVKSMEEHGCNIALEAWPGGVLSLTIENDTEGLDIRMVHCNKKQAAVESMLRAKRWIK